MSYAQTNWSYSISTRATWTGAWVSADPSIVLCTRISKNCIGQIEAAAFKLKTGRILPSGGTWNNFSVASDFAGKWIKVVYFNPGSSFTGVWVGYCLPPDEMPFAAADLGAGLALQGGDFDFVAVCPKYFLDRRPITDTVYYSEDDEEEPIPYRAKRAIGFNTGIGGEDRDVTSAERGNKDSRTVDLSAIESTWDETPVFCSDPAEREEWNATDILDYLLAFESLRNQDDEPAPFTIRISESSDITWMKPTIRTEGRTTLSIINEIVNPGNGYVWWLEYEDAGDLNDANDYFSLHYTSVVGSDVSLPGGATLDAANSLVVLNIDTEPTVLGRPTIGNAQNKRYDRVRVRGARRTATFTVSPADDNLVKAWEDDLETAYKEADGETEAKAADRFRKAEKFASVYSRFRVPLDWDGKTRDGSGSGDFEYACPEILPESSSITGGAPLSLVGMRLMRHTVLKEGYDYTDATAPTHGDPTAVTPELMQPLAIGKQGEAYFPLDRAAGDGDSEDLSCSYHMTVLSGAPALEIKPNKGLPHLIAKNHFDPDDEGTAPSKYAAELDYEEIRVTVSAEWDEYCEGVYPEGEITAEPMTEYLIDIGERARWDYLAENTVFDVQGSTIKKCTTGGSLRDDRELCRRWAKAIYQWYAEERKTLTVTYSQIKEPASLGVFITQFGVGATLRTAGCTVTQIDHNLEDGTSTIVAGFEDLEFAGGLG